MARGLASTSSSLRGRRDGWVQRRQHLNGVSHLTQGRDGSLPALSLRRLEMLLERLRSLVLLTRTRFLELSARGGGGGSRGGGMFSLPFPKRGLPEGPASLSPPPFMAGGPEPPDATSLICERDGTALVLCARRSIPPRLRVATPRPRDDGAGDGVGDADAPFPPRLEPKRDAERVSVGEAVGGRVLRRSVDAVRAGDRADGAVALRRRGERRVRRDDSGVSGERRSLSSGCSSAARVRFGAGMLSCYALRMGCARSDARSDVRCELGKEG